MVIILNYILLNDRICALSSRIVHILMLSSCLLDFWYLYILEQLLLLDIVFCSLLLRSFCLLCCLHQIYILHHMVHLLLFFVVRTSLVHILLFSLFRHIFHILLHQLLLLFLQFCLYSCLQLHIYRINFCHILDFLGFLLSFLLPFLHCVLVLLP